MSARVEFYRDHVTHLVVEGHPLRVIEVDVLASAREAAARLEATDAAAALLGEALAVVALLSGHIKGEERLTLHVLSDGEAGRITADCTAAGDLRARLLEPKSVGTGQTLEQRRLSLLGSGQLLVIKSLPEREIYRGHAPFARVNLGGALEIYLERSEQVKSVVALATEVESPEAGGRLTRARGLLIQGMGGGDEDLIQALLRSLPRQKLVDGLNRELPVHVLLEALLPELRLAELEIKPLRYQCTCSEQRVLAMLMALGAEELKLMLERDQGAVVTCEFCQTRFEVGSQQLEHLMALVAGSA